jgi:hypothetical protein
MRNRGMFQLRLALMASAFGWGLSFLAALAPWSVVAKWIQAIGGIEPPAHPQIQYWVRMAGAGFGFIGLFYLILSRDPWRHRDWLAFAGLLDMAVGFVLLFHGWRLGLPADRLCVDVGFCLVCGLGILAFKGDVTEPLAH